MKRQLIAVFITNSKFKIVEKFVSIDGEGPTAGALSVFIRFAGCNLSCVWCDTCYAQASTSFEEEMTLEELVAYIRSTEIAHVTLTGGEPLLQEGLVDLLRALDFVQIHIETNGSIDITPFRVGPWVHFVVDYKLPGSGMEDAMYLINLEKVDETDAYKFVIANQADLIKAIALVYDYDLVDRTQVFFSTVFGEIQPVQVVEALIEHKLNGVRMQLQLHKYIWDKNQRGV